MTHLLYITLGNNPALHLQCAFSALSFQSYLGDAVQVTVLTDAPHWYKNLDVTTAPLNEATQQQWKGKYGFFWRIKIKALEWAAQQYAGEPVFYLDTDTFAYQNPAPLMQALQGGQALMHLNEGALKNIKGKTVKQMGQQLQRMCVPGLSSSSAMWNAGVVASPNNKGGAEYKMALDLCDAMLDAGVTPRLIEQLALSVALQQCYGLQAADKIVAHYWSNKEQWNLWIAQFFAQQLIQSTGSNSLINSWRQIDWTTVPAILLAQRNTARRLHRLADRWFPAQEKPLSSHAH